MKRRSFLGAIAAVFVAPKLLEAVKPEPELTLADLYREPPLSEEEWMATYAPAKEPLTVCPNCGRFRTVASSRVLVVAPSGVASMAEGDYLPMPSLPRFVDGCLRCAEDLEEAYARL